MRVLTDLWMNLPRRGLLVLVALYRAALSPHLGTSCRFSPSCSTYAEEAILVHGAGRGAVLAFRRLLRCRPGGPSGFDPVPQARLR